MSVSVWVSKISFKTEFSGFGLGLSFHPWLYAWEMHNSCVVYFAKDTRGISWKREKAVHVFCRVGKAFDRVRRKVAEWALRKKGLPEVLVQAMMSFYEGLRTKIRGGSGLLEEFGVSVGVHQGSVLSPLIFAIVVDVVTKDATKRS